MKLQTLQNRVAKAEAAYSIAKGNRVNKGERLESRSETRAATRLREARAALSLVQDPAPMNSAQREAMLKEMGF